MTIKKTNKYNDTINRAGHVGDPHCQRLRSHEKIFWNLGMK